SLRAPIGGDNKDMESGRNGSGREAGATTRRPRDSERAAAEQEAAERARQHAQAATRARARAAERDRRRAERPAGTATAVAERDSTARPGAPEVSETAGELPPGRYLDREESWLRFDQRVLELAEDPEIPLLERVRFESIFASGMDEFFMVRVAGRIRRMATGLPVEMASGKPSDEIL